MKTIKTETGLVLGKERQEFTDRAVGRFGGPYSETRIFNILNAAV